MKRVFFFPSRIQKLKMQGRLIEQVSLLAEERIRKIILGQLNLRRKQILKEEDQVSIADEVIENIIMGILLGEESYLNAFKLLYRVKFQTNSARINDISIMKLLGWLDTEKMRQYLFDKIVEFSLGEQIVPEDRDSMISFEAKSGCSPGDRKDSEKDQKTYQASKFINSSPAATEESEMKNEEQDHKECQQIQIHQEEYDIYGMLFMNGKCQTPVRREEVGPFQGNQEELQLEGHIENSNQCSQKHKSQEQEKNEVKFSEDILAEDRQRPQEHFTLLKLTDAHPNNDQEEDNLLSEVSSFAYDSNNYLNLNMYQLEDTCRYGHLLYGDKVDKILRSFSSNHCNFMLLKWFPRKDGSIPLESIIESSTLKEHCPRLLIEYYETQLKS